MQRLYKRTPPLRRADHFDQTKMEPVKEILSDKYIPRIISRSAAKLNLWRDTLAAWNVEISRSFHA